MIARKSFLIVISHIIVQIIGGIGLVIIAKLWGNFAPEALGIIAFAMSFLALFNIIADLGFSQAHIKRVSEGKDLGTCIGTFAAIKIILIGIMVTIVFVSIFIWKSILQKEFYDATTESIIFVFLAYYIFSNLSLIATVTFTGKKEIAKRSIPSIFGRAFKLPFLIMVVLAGVNLANIFPETVTGIPTLSLSLLLILILIFRSSGITGGFEININQVISPFTGLKSKE